MNPAKPEDFDPTQAHIRAVNDKNTSSDFRKLGFQLLFAANGGSALALFNFIGNSLGQEHDLFSFQEMQYFTVSLLLYLFGVLLCPITLLTFSMSFHFYGAVWEQRTRETIDIDRHRRNKKRAYRLESLGLLSMLASIAAFFLGPILFALPFLM